MSLRAMLWAFEQECPSPAAKLVLIKLADHADNDGCCWPSQALVAKDTGLTRETVNRQVKALVSAGLLDAEQQGGANGKRPSHYKLRCDLLSQPSQDVATDHIEGNNTVTPIPCDIPSHPDVTTDHTPCDLSSHKPSIEPSKEEPEASASGESARARDPDKERSDGRSRKTRIATDWQPDFVDCEYAAARGWFSGRIAEQAEAFRDHHVERESAFKDWNAAWRTWVRRADEFAAARNGSGGAGSYGRSAPQSGGIATAMRAVLSRRDLG